MNTRPPFQRARASALIIVLWISFGLVAVTLYFADSMAHEFRASDNRACTIAADQAIAGTVRYVTNVLYLAQQNDPGAIPATNAYRFAEMPIGEARVWLIGRNDFQNFGAQQAWGLTDEASKLNLNMVTTEMLQYLPGMTPQIAAAIIDWRDSNDEVSDNGAESETYLRQETPYQAKNANFESPFELRLVYGADIDLIFGEDANLNGVLDANENDSTRALPNDNRDGRLNPGFLEYFTTFTRLPTGATNITDATGLQTLVESRLGSANGIALSGSYSNIFEFYCGSGMTLEQFRQIEGFIVHPGATNALVNINTAPEAVLACIPGIGPELAPSVVSYRQGNSSATNTVAWLKDALGWNYQDHATQIRQVGNYITGRSHHVSADIAAVGPNGRGYRRVKYVFDTADGVLRVAYRQDLTYLGWALGTRTRETLLARNTR